VIQTIPSLALLAVMVPLLASLGLVSIGFLPALIGLTLYSVLPILRNTVAGLTGIDPAVIEAARGVGMTSRQQLWRVELPLAMPVILAGLRTATVWTVGAATLSTPVGAPSLGNYIFTGLQTRNLTAILVGCAGAALLALALDALVHSLGQALIARRRVRLAGTLAVVAALCVYSALAFVQTLGAGRTDRIVIGTKTFTEQYILGDLMAGQIQRSTGTAVQVLSSLGSTVAFDALRTGQIDAYVDYSGTIWATIMKREAPTIDREAVLAEVGRYLRQEHGIVIVGALGFENAYALAAPRRLTENSRVTRIGDLAPLSQRLTMGGDYEFFGRPEWMAVKARYGLEFRELKTMDPSLMYQAVAAGDVDVISAFSTDGRIAALDLVVLEDDRGAIPPYDAIILAGSRVAAERPDVVKALGALAGTIDEDRMREMNLAVDQDGAQPAAVAGAFLDTLAR
jgi:osmoprotectant transport system permease protein